MKVIIFSKNRAMQLEALLRSLPANLAVSVIYCASNSFYQKGYNKLMEVYRCVFLKQAKKDGELKRLLAHVFHRNIHKHVAFMVDDDIVYNQNWPEISLKANECYSLRLHPGIKNKIHHDYTISLDGNIFRVKDIEGLISNITFSDPNQLESKLQGRYGKQFKMKYGCGYLIGFNHNRVSDTSHCAFTGNFHEEYLNTLFLKGSYIDYEGMKLKPINNIHTDQKYIFKK